MSPGLDLGELGKRLKMVDQHVIALLAQRMDLAKQVETYKRIHQEPLIRLGIEDERIDGARVLAKTKGLNPNFVASFLYFIIAEACRVEISQMQEAPVAQDLSPEQLKANLLTLTKEVAPSYNKNYTRNSFATRAYLEFEESTIKREIKKLKALGMLDLALDLGCATGKISFKLAESFQRVVGYDISPEMIEEAQKNLLKAKVFDNIEFKVTDIEGGIPEEDNSVSLVVMSLGTASDIFNLQKVLVDIRRILKPDGRVLFSFYNSGALIYRCWFVPWPVSLAASVNQVKCCLSVRLDDKVFSIYARPYSVSEIKQILAQAGFVISVTATYPTISAILPNEFFEEPSMQKIISEIDDQLADLESGAYALVAAEKREGGK